LHKGAWGFSSHSEQQGSACEDAELDVLSRLSVSRQISMTNSKEALLTIELVSTFNIICLPFLEKVVVVLTKLKYLSAGMPDEPD
jgi:hypothetical protein